MSKISVDGHDYTYTKDDSYGDYELDVLDCDNNSIGTIVVNDNHESIAYHRDTGESGSLNYFEFAEMENTEESLVQWLAATSYV